MSVHYDQNVMVILLVVHNIYREFFTLFSKLKCNLYLKRILLLMPLSTLSPNIHNQLVNNSRFNEIQNNVTKKCEINCGIDDNLIKLNSNNNTNNLTNGNHLNIKNENFESKTDIELYFQRWIILFIFCIITLLSAFNWIEYSIIQDVVIEFYNESLPTINDDKYDAVNWLSMVYMLAYIPLVFPTMFLLDRKGLKLSIVLGASINCIGAIIKCASVRSDLFLVAMLGQTLCAVAQAFTLAIPARLSAIWFGQNEVATATSVNF